MHPATAPIHATTALGRNATPLTTTTTLCHENVMGMTTRDVVDKLVYLQHMGKASRLPLGETSQEKNPLSRENHLNPIVFPPPNCATCYRSGVVSTPLPDLHLMDDTGPDYCTTERPFFLSKKIPASHRARGGTPNERL